MLEQLSNEFIKIYKKQSEMIENYNQEYAGMFIAWFDKGFIKWKFANAKNLMICDIYIQPEHRGKNLATIYAELLLEQVQSYTCGIWFISGMVQRDYKYHGRTVRIMKKFGATKVEQSNKALPYDIYMKKL